MFCLLFIKESHNLVKVICWCFFVKDSLKREDLQSMVEHGERLRKQLKLMEDRFGNEEYAQQFLERFRAVLELVLLKVDEVLPPNSGVF